MFYMSLTVCLYSSALSVRAKCVGSKYVIYQTVNGRCTDEFIEEHVLKDLGVHCSERS